MFPEFIQVSLNSGWVVYKRREGAYISDTNWVIYLGGVYSGELIYGRTC